MSGNVEGRMNLEKNFKRFNEDSKYSPISHIL